MEFYEVIGRRRTVRDFENESIPAETLERIIAAGFKAPTNDHMRDWQFLVITEKAVAARLLEAVPEEISDNDIDRLIQDWNLNDTLQQECYRNAVPKQYRMLFDASAILIPLLKQKTDIMHPENISHLNGFASIWCCIENIFLAATAEGYGCNLRVPLGNESDHAREVLEFPEDCFMPCFIGIGRPREGIAPLKQKEIDLKERIRWNHY